MHFHHKHDVGGCTDAHTDWPDWATTILATIDRQGYMLMAVTQQSADHAAAVISELVAKVTELEAAQAPAVDSSKLDEALAAADAALAPAAPAPVAEPAPAPADAAPVDPLPVDPATTEIPAQPAGDGTVPAQGIPSVPLA